jgi:hypothetical protein
METTGIPMFALVKGISEGRRRKRLASAVGVI